MAEMLKQIIFLCLWISMAFYSIAVSTTEIPKECTVGTPEYNEKLCNETCTQEAHASKPYCANYTQSQPQQEVHSAVTLPEVNLTPLETVQNIETSTPKINVTDTISSASSLQSSLIFSFLSFIIFF